MSGIKRLRNHLQGAAELGADVSALVDRCLQES